MPRATKKEDRKVISVLVPGAGFSLREFDCEDVDAIIERLQDLKLSCPGQKLELRIEQEAYCDFESYRVYEKRPETDEEMAARQAKEAGQRQQVDARERQEFERLSKRFGKP